MTAPTASEAASFSPRYVQYVLWLILLVAVFNTCDRTILSILMDDIKRDIEVSDAELGFLAGMAFASVHLLAGLPIARLADRTSRKTVVSVGLLAWSAMTALAGLAQSFGQLLLARMGVGIGEAAGSPPSHSMIADYAPAERRARSMAMLPIGALVGMGFGTVFGGWVNEYWGWRAAFFAVGLPGVLLAFVFYGSVREPPRGLSDGQTETADPGSMWAVIAYLLRQPSYRLLIAGACMAGITTFGRNLWEPTFLRRVYEMGSAEAGTWYFLIGPLPSGLGAYLGGLWVDRLARRDQRWYMWFSAAVSAASVPLSLAFLLWPESQRVGVFPVAFAFSIALGLIGGMWAPAVMTMGQGLARPRMRSLSAALWTMIYNFVGLGIGPWIVGILSVRLEATQGVDAIRYALAVASLASLLSAGLFWWGARTIRADLASSRG